MKQSNQEAIKTLHHRPSHLQIQGQFPVLRKPSSDERVFSRAITCRMSLFVIANFRSNYCAEPVRVECRYRGAVAVDAHPPTSSLLPNTYQPNNLSVCPDAIEAREQISHRVCCWCSAAVMVPSVCLRRRCSTQPSLFNLSMCACAVKTLGGTQLASD